MPLLESRWLGGKPKITSNNPFVLGEENNNHGCGTEILYGVEGEIGNIVESVNIEEETVFDHDIDHSWC